MAMSAEQSTAAFHPQTLPSLSLPYPHQSLIQHRPDLALSWCTLPEADCKAEQQHGCDRQQQQQQQQSASGVGRRRRGGGQNNPETNSSVLRGETKFECHQSVNTFASRGGLQYHTLTHSGVKNHKCDECGKKFARKSHLTTHTLTHSSVKLLKH